MRTTGCRREMIASDRFFRIGAPSLGVLLFNDSAFSKTLLLTRGSSISGKTARCYREKLPKKCYILLIAPPEFSITALGGEKKSL